MAGFDDAMQAALATEPALGADETPVNVLTPDNDPQTGEPETGSPHVLVIRTPGGNLTWLRALGSRRAEAITTILGFFTGFLITDGYTAYQQLLPKLAGIQQCAAHVIRRCRAVAGLGPGSLQSWAADIIEILREARHLTEQARARDGPGDAEPLAKLRERYDEAIASAGCAPSASHGCRPRLTAPTMILIASPRMTRSAIICPVTTSRAAWVLAVMSPNPTVENTVTVKYKPSVCVSRAPKLLADIAAMTT
jgi:hypothetical protein